MLQIVPIARTRGIFGVYEHARLLFRGTLDECLAYRRAHDFGGLVHP